MKEARSRPPGESRQTFLVPYPFHRFRSRSCLATSHIHDTLFPLTQTACFPGSIQIAQRLLAEGNATSRRFPSVSRSSSQLAFLTALILAFAATSQCEELLLLARPGCLSRRILYPSTRRQARRRSRTPRLGSDHLRRRLPALVSSAEKRSRRCRTSCGTTTR